MLQCHKVLSTCLTATSSVPLTAPRLTPPSPRVRLAGASREKLPFEFRIVALERAGQRKRPMGRPDWWSSAHVPLLSS
ncbi:hypothetical protein AAFF_G00289570 [Aldrovandia affinis]|uniref:Uncharacterized protein n=1 Tax=Aldrovandia affinis TaxID=143900 RepID=A0AAD7W0Y9_9TELE|nr:hypothetical protein AAFF_G00289570 [Aldrovandia affinis]